MLTMVDTFAISERDTILQIVPMFHANGWGIPYAGVMTGAKMVFTGRNLQPADVAHLNTGLVAAGRQADFIVLDANPLESISNTRRINKVFLRGQEVPRAALAAKWQAKFRQTASAQ